MGVYIFIVYISLRRAKVCSITILVTKKKKGKELRKKDKKARIFETVV